MEMVDFTRSIKFKMAVWCSTLLLSFSMGFILIVNVLLTQYMKNFDPLKPIFPRGTIIIKNLGIDEIEVIQKSRSNDLTNIRIFSLYSIIPLTLLSFTGGYLIADKTLEPLDRLKDVMRKKKSENLGEEITYVDNGDEISGLIESFNDMSKRLSRTFNAQKEFVENASHEIKTPLAIIQANLDAALLDKKIEKKEIRELLDECRKSVKFMNTLTEDLLLLSILDSKIETEDLNVCELLNDIQNQIKDLAARNGIKINIDCDNKHTLVGNKVFIQRALLNLVENAIKYSKGKNIDIKVIMQRKSLILSIKDDGIGISKEHEDKIFERFYRVDKSRSRQSGGSGLGLSITKEIIERHSGKVYLNTKSKKGAEFIIEFKV